MAAGDPRRNIFGGELTIAPRCSIRGSCHVVMTRVAVSGTTEVYPDRSRRDSCRDHRCFGLAVRNHQCFSRVRARRGLPCWGAVLLPASGNLFLAGGRIYQASDRRNRGPDGEILRYGRRANATIQSGAGMETVTQKQQYHKTTTKPTTNGKSRGCLVDTTRVCKCKCRF